MSHSIASEETPGLDILADLESTPKKRPGVVCRVETMRRQRPELAREWDRAIDGKRTGALSHSDTDIAGWFTGKGFPVSTQIVSRHRNDQCELCRDVAA